MPIRPPAPTASTANAQDDSGKLFAPSAARNAAALCTARRTIAPQRGTVLEIASGTGQHVVTFAASMPHLLWHPSEVEQTRLTSIAVHIRESGLKNINVPIMLDATKIGWGRNIEPKELITLANLLHLISEPEVETLLSEASEALCANGVLSLYGPFKRDGKLTSDGDVTFDASLRAHDPDTGYKDDSWIKETARSVGLRYAQTIEMPANNLLMVFDKAL